MKLGIDNYQSIMALMSIGVNEKAVTPQGDCILIEEDNLYAFNGAFYVNVPLEESLEIRAAVRFQKLMTFIKSMKSGSNFTIKKKKKALLLKCGAIKQQVGMEDEILIPYSNYAKELSEVKWRKVGMNFKETLMQKSFTSPNVNDVLNSICFNKKGVYASNSIEVYYTPESPLPSKTDILIPASVAEALSRVVDPFTHFAVTDTIVAFKTELGAVIAFPKRIDEYPKIIRTLLKKEITGDELDLGDADLNMYINSSAAVAERCQTGSDKYKLLFASGELELSTSSDKGSSVFKTEVHSSANVEMYLSSSVLHNISSMGGSFVYDGEKLVKIVSSTFQYLAAAVLG